ncbi:DUF7507 domain-containing protein [Nitratireductor indicus]|nr:DUF11 domain-containing protein [Nitratireductor indicus]
MSLIQVVKTASLGGNKAGDTATFTMTVQNSGTETLTDVSISEDFLERSDGTALSLTSGPTFVSNSGASPQGTLVPDETATFTATYNLTQADVDAGGISNQAVGVGTSPTVGEVSAYSRASAGAQDAPTVVTIPRDPKISLSKRGVVADTNSNGITDAGDTINYTFTITNTGNVALSNITVTDPGATLVGNPIASLAPDASDATTISGSRVLTQADIDAGEVQNTASVSGTSPGGVIVSDGANDTLTIEAVHRLHLEKNGVHIDANGNDAFDPGETIEYTFTLTNMGNVAISNIVLTDPTATVVTGQIASLAPGATDTSSLTATYPLTQEDVNAGKVENTAQVNGKGPTGVDVSDDATTMVTGNGIEKISLQKSGDLVDANGNGVADAGETISYSFVVTNTGNVTLSNITVSDPFAPVSGGPLATLAPNDSDSSTFSASYPLTQADIDAGRLENTATALARSPAGNDIHDEGETTIMLPASEKVSLTKTATYRDTNGNGVADIGDHIDYAFTVENAGNVTLSNLTVSDPLVSISGGPLATLAPGASDSSTFSASYPLTQADIDAGVVDNTAGVSGTAPDNGPVTDTASATAQLARVPALRLTKTAIHQDTNGNGAADVGEPVTFTFSVTNTGNVTVTNVEIEDPGVTLSGSPIASLAPGATDSSTYTASYPLTQDDIDAGSMSNTARVKGSAPDSSEVSDSASASVSLAGTAGIGLVKSGTYQDTNGNGVVDLGDAIAYGFSVENQGNVTLTDIEVTDPGVSVSGGPLASLAPGVTDSTTFSALYMLTQADIDAGKVDNSAEVEGVPPGNGGTGTPVSASSDVSVPLERKPAISLTKTGAYVDANGNGVADAGDTISYSFVVTNTGNVTLSNLTVSDPLVSVSGGPLATLAPGASDSSTFSASYPLTQADIDAGVVLNEASVSGSGPDGTSLSASSGDVSVTIERKPEAEFIKSAMLNDANGNGLADAGETISYSFTARNTGNVTLTDLTVSDAKVTVSGGPLASLEPGNSDSTTFTAVYSITQADVDAGKVENTALLKAKGPGGEDLEWPSRPPEGTGPTIVEFERKADIVLELTAVLVDGNGNGIADAGESVSYRFIVRNVGNATLSDVSIASLSVLEDGGASGARTVTVSGGPLASLAPGGEDTGTFTASYVLTQADIDAGGIAGTARAVGKGSGGEEVSVLSDDPSDTSNEDSDGDGKPDDPTRTPLEQKALLGIEKSGAFQWSPNEVLEAGDTILYTFEIVNEGNVSLSGVVPEDDGPNFGGKAATGRLSAYMPAEASLAPGERQTFTATYVLSDADIANARNIEDAVKNTARAQGQGPKGAAGSSEASAVLNLPGFVISKMTPLSEVRRGGRVPYVIRVRSLGIPEETKVTVLDQIPQGFSFVPGSATLRGAPVTARIDGRRLAFENVSLQPEEAVEIGLVLTVTASAKPGEYINRAWLENDAGTVLSSVATAMVEVVIEAVFDCGDILGKVFDDRNRNGYQDAGEPGLAGVRVAAVKGLLVTSDQHGRFHVACAELPDQRIGTNYILKLDPRSLPSGYRITTENPRVVRLTAGKVSEFSFGASIGRVVRLDLTDDAFERGMVELRPEWLSGLNQLIAVLDQEPSVLRLSYYGADGRSRLAARRLRTVSKAISEEWLSIGGRYRLDIETRSETGSPARAGKTPGYK